MPIWRRARRSPFWLSRVSSMSFRKALPPVGSISRLMQRIMVDLPAPDGPISATTWPFGISRLTSFSARSPVA